jgi:hypothetical protein
MYTVQLGEILLLSEITTKHFIYLLGGKIHIISYFTLSPVYYITFWILLAFVDCQ